MATQPGLHWFFTDTLPYLARWVLIPAFVLMFAAMMIAGRVREDSKRIAPVPLDPWIVTTPI